MKLSEILSKPLKLAGGGILDLRGISKFVIDKEFKSNFPYTYIAIPDQTLSFSYDESYYKVLFNAKDDITNLDLSDGQYAILKSDCYSFPSQPNIQLYFKSIRKETDYYRFTLYDGTNRFVIYIVKNPNGTTLDDGVLYNYGDVVFAYIYNSPASAPLSCSVIKDFVILYYNLS